MRILHEPEDFYGNKRHFDGLSCSVAEPSHAKFRWYHNGTLVDREYSLKFRSFDTADLWVDKSKVDLRYQGIYQPFVSSSFGTIFGRKIEVKFKGMV